MGRSRARTVGGTGERSRTPPFGHLHPAVAAAVAYAAATVVWLAGGEAMPGGRWFAVHLFTLGVLTNLIVALTHHFAQTLLRVPGSGSSTRLFLVLNVGALLVLAFPSPWRIPTAIGAVLAMTAACAWFPVVAWADAAVVATGEWQLLNALGAALLAGVLGQAVLGSLCYLAPMVWATGTAARAAARDALGRFGAPRLVVHNGATAALVAGVAGGRLFGVDLGVLTASRCSWPAPSVTSVSGSAPGTRPEQPDSAAGPSRRPVGRS